MTDPSRVNDKPLRPEIAASWKRCRSPAIQFQNMRNGPTSRPRSRRIAPSASAVASCSAERARKILSAGSRSESHGSIPRSTTTPRTATTRDAGTIDVPALMALLDCGLGGDERGLTRIAGRVDGPSGLTPDDALVQHRNCGVLFEDEAFGFENCGAALGAGGGRGRCGECCIDLRVAELRNVERTLAGEVGVHVRDRVRRTCP